MCREVHCAAARAIGASDRALVSVAVRLRVGVGSGAVGRGKPGGDVLEPATGGNLTADRNEDGKRQQETVATTLRGQLSPGMRPGTATTIGVIACDAKLTKAQCQKLAQIAHDGLARSINPGLTHFDGDTIFPLATGTSEPRGKLPLLGVLAADATTRSARS